MIGEGEKYLFTRGVPQERWIGYPEDFADQMSRWDMMIEYLINSPYMYSLNSSSGLSKSWESLILPFAKPNSRDFSFDFDFVFRNSAKLASSVTIFFGKELISNFSGDTVIAKI